MESKLSFLNPRYDLLLKGQVLNMLTMVSCDLHLQCSQVFKDLIQHCG